MKFIYLQTSFLKVTNIYAEIVYFFFLKKVTLLKQTVFQERIFFKSNSIWISPQVSLYHLK